MNNILIVALAINSCALCYMAYKLHRVHKGIKEIYDLPHGESLYSINHHEFNSVGIQYILIATRTLMHIWMQQSVAAENFESAESWKQSILEVEKLIKTKINK